MKKWKRILAVMICVLFVQVPLTALSEPVAVEAAVKSGLKKEKKQYYYYVKGKRVKNTWKTVKVKSKGKKVSYRYYFGKNGAAYKGKKSNGVVIPAVKRIKGKYYGFSNTGRMVKGTYYIKNKLYSFSSKNGVYNASATKKLRNAAVRGKDAKTLRKLLGKPAKTKTYSYSCYGDGKDVLLYYSHVIVALFKDKTGKEIIVGLSAK